MLGMSSTAPDPNSYLNQSEITKQKKSVMSSLTSTVGSIDSIASIAKVIPGMPPSITAGLSNLKKDAGSLLSKAATMGPDVIEKERGVLEAKLQSIQETVAKQNDAAKIKALADAKATVAARRKVIDNDSTIPRDIKLKYDAIDAMQGASAEDILNALANADDDLLVAENKEFSGIRLMKRAWRASANIIFYVLCGLAGLVGGIIASNTYYAESFWAIKLYYFFYGVAFFPVALVYALVRPPVWHATIMPLYPLTAPAAGIMQDFFGYQVTDESAAPVKAGSLRIVSAATIATLIAFTYERGNLEPLLAAIKKKV